MGVWKWSLQLSSRKLSAKRKRRSCRFSGQPWHGSMKRFVGFVSHLFVKFFYLQQTVTFVMSLPTVVDSARVLSCWVVICNSYIHAFIFSECCFSNICGFVDGFTKLISDASWGKSVPVVIALLILLFCLHFIGTLLAAGF